MSVELELLTAPAFGGPSVGVAADTYLDGIANANTRRAYTAAITAVAELLGRARPLAGCGDEEIGEALEDRWRSCAAATWNARRGAVAAWLTWCRRHGYTAPAVPAWCRRCAVGDTHTPVRSAAAIDRLIARRDIGLREKTLWRALYETAARAGELLALNVEDLDLTARRAPVRGKGAPPLRRGEATGGPEWVYWDAGTARLLARLLRGRTAGPVFLTVRRPAVGKRVDARDLDPVTGCARLSYGRARQLLDAATADHGPGTGWDLHELRHSALTHLGEADVSLPLLMAKSRHRDLRQVRRYVRPGPTALAQVTALLGPDDHAR